MSGLLPKTCASISVHAEHIIKQANYLFVLSPLFQTAASNYEQKMDYVTMTWTGDATAITLLRTVEEEKQHISEVCSLGFWLKMTNFFDSWKTILQELGVRRFVRVPCIAAFEFSKRENLTKFQETTVQESCLFYGI